MVKTDFWSLIVGMKLFLYRIQKTDHFLKTDLY